MSFDRMWSDLRSVGRSRTSGGYFRQAFGSAERECHAWFVEQARVRGLAVEHDGNGNVVAWWRPPECAERRALLTGSHLDSVLDGGAFDGPLGVVSALAAIDLLRDRRFAPTRPIGVAVFAAEEGSRFGVACLGSRLLTGALSADKAQELRDRDGVFLRDAMADAGLDPEIGQSDLPGRVAAFVELHVEQGRDLADRDRAVGVGSEIWPHSRFRFEFTGEANHAGTTRMADRRDPMLTYAATALAAGERARREDTCATFGRIEVEPNGTNAVPSVVRAWLDARAAAEESLRSLVNTIERAASDRAARDGTSVSVTAESVTPTTRFDADLAARLSHRLDDAPIIPTGAGHDAGVLALAGIPTAMLFVRNPSGVSHSPAEHAERGDCLTGVAALANCLADLAG